MEEVWKAQICLSRVQFSVYCSAMHDLMTHIRRKLAMVENMRNG
jgi:hypothetical protein